MNKTSEKFILYSLSSLKEEFQTRLSGKEQGFIMLIPVGGGLFPASLMPSMEIILLDPDEMTIAFRKVSNNKSKNMKKGLWEIGNSSTAAEKLLAWQKKMISIKADSDAYEIVKL